MIKRRLNLAPNKLVATLEPLLTVIPMVFCFSHVFFLSKTNVSVINSDKIVGQCPASNNFET